MADRKAFLKDRVAANRASKKNRYAEGGMAEDSASADPTLLDQTVDYVNDIRAKDQESQDNLMVAAHKAGEAVRGNAGFAAYETPESQRVAEDNLNVAMGSTNALSPNAVPVPLAVSTAQQKLNAIQQLMEQHSAQGLPLGNLPAQLQRAIDNVSRVASQYNSRGQRFAEGGPVNGDEIQYEQLSPANAPENTHSDEPAGLDAFIEPELMEEKYGTTEQMLKTGAEGLASGLVGSTITNAAETALGVNPADIRGREETNPGIHLASEVAGFVGPAIATAGASLAGKAGVVGGLKAAEALTASGALAKAGEAFSAATQIGEKGGWVAKAGADAAKAAFEGALFQLDQEGGKLFKQDPEQSAGSAISDIGLATVMSGVFGGAIGAGLRKLGAHPEEIGAAAKLMEEHTGVAAGEPMQFIPELDKAKLAAGDFKAAIEHSSDFKPLEKTGIIAGLAKRKINANEIEKIAEQRGYPVMEGMISDHKLVQRAEDALINGGGTSAALKRQELYKDAYGKAAADVDATLGDGSKLSKAEIGDQFKQTLASQIKEENAPIKGMYDALKLHNEHIPLSLDTGRVILELENMPDFKLTGNLPGGGLIKGALEGIAKSQTVDDLKIIRSSINGSLSHSSSPNERRIAALVSDKLRQLEEDSIEKFAHLMAKTPEDKAIALGLNAARKAADAEYKPFIQKIQKLSKMLGKGNISGPQDAIRFINELTPEQMTTRLFNKNNSQSLKFFEKEFPQQAAQMRDYQRGILRDAATKEGVLSPKDLFNRINKLEPEVQSALFSKAELKTLKDAETYIRSFPANFNPSGTAHAMALRDSFMQGTGMVGGLLSGNVMGAIAGVASPHLRDAAIERFIKSVGASPKAQQAIALAKATASGERTATKAVRSILSATPIAMPANVVSMVNHREKLSKLVDTYHADPEKLMGQGDSNPIPEYAQAFSATTARAVQYLAGLRPDTAPKNPLDTKVPATPMQKAIYNNALDIAQQPLHILQKIKAGTLTNQDLTTIKTIYPSVYANLSTKIMNGIVESKRKGQSIPYQTRLQLSMFLGQPLDSTMTQPSIAAAQAKPLAQQQQAETQSAPASGAKHSTSKLGKSAVAAQTPGQARLASRSDNKL